MNFYCPNCQLRLTWIKELMVSERRYGCWKDQNGCGWWCWESDVHKHAIGGPHEAPAPL